MQGDAGRACIDGPSQRIAASLSFRLELLVYRASALLMPSGLVCDVLFVLLRWTGFLGEHGGAD
eukprot:COSAG02_NODE_3319_length_6948_cov_2.445759_4_plen_64_part_00